MHAFDRTENAPSLLDAVEVPGTVTTGELNPQEAAATRIVAETRECIGDLETETARHREIIAVTHAEQVRRVAAVREGRERLEELMEELEGAQYELAVVHSPILLLPYELMVEIFDWHMAMGEGRLLCYLCANSGRQWRTVVPNFGLGSLSPIFLFIRAIFEAQFSAPTSTTCV